MHYGIGPGSFGIPTTNACLTVDSGTRSLGVLPNWKWWHMRRNWYTTTGLALAIAALVLAGCGSADAEKGKGKGKGEKVEKVEKVEKEKEVEGKPKAKVEKRGLSDLQRENASDSQSAVAAAVTKSDLTYM